MEDAQLIIACKKQDRKAQKALYEKYAPIMMSVCMRYCKDEETSRDLLHDGFIRVFTQIGSFSSKGSFEGWLRRIFVNLALENYRKEQKKHRFIEEYSYLSNSDSNMMDEDSLDIENILQEEVFEMIRSLPTGYRTVFNLFVFEDLSHKEIADQLRISESASRSQFFRAKNLLKKKITAKLGKSHLKQMK